MHAARLTNRWISGSWWRRDAVSDEHLLGTKHGLLMCRSTRRKSPGEQWSRRETEVARPSKWCFETLVEEHDAARPSLRNRSEMRGRGVHARALSIRALCAEIGRPPGRPACETLVCGKSHSNECNTHQDAWDENRTKGVRVGSNGVANGSRIQRHLRRRPWHAHCEANGQQRHQMIAPENGRKSGHHNSHQDAHAGHIGR